jgi:hypothetical protein
VEHSLPLRPLRILRTLLVVGIEGGTPKWSLPTRGLISGISREIKSRLATKIVVEWQAAEGIGMTTVGLAGACSG